MASKKCATKSWSYNSATQECRLYIDVINPTPQQGTHLYAVSDPAAGAVDKNAEALKENDSGSASEGQSNI